MSYVRFGSDSDVYVYPDGGGFVCCFGCLLAAAGSSSDDVVATDLHSPEEAAAHMQAHVDAGHKVPAGLLNPAAFTDRPFDPFSAGE